MIGFGFASHWLKNWHESFKPITKGSNHNHVITFDSHLKTALVIILVATLRFTVFFIPFLFEQQCSRWLNKCFKRTGVGRQT